MSSLLTAIDGRTMTDIQGHQWKNGVNVRAGDRFTINGVCADGTIGDGEEKQWEVASVDKLRIYLIPLNKDGSVDEFNNAAGSFSLNLVA